MGNSQKPLMHQYSPVEQEKLLGTAIKAFYHATSYYPGVFRAGGYGADNTTLKLLPKFGITTDSSYFPGHPNCRIEPATPNIVSRIESIQEVPVTVFKNKIDYYLGNKVVKQGTILKKLDLDSCTLEELKLGLDAVGESKIKVIIFFMHSYSLIKWNPTYTRFEPDFNDMEKLYSFLEYANEQDYTFTTFHDLLKFLPDETERDYTIPEIHTRRRFITSVERAISSKVRGILRGK
jgi:hypothetical protein